MSNRQPHMFHISIATHTPVTDAAAIQRLREFVNTAAARPGQTMTPAVERGVELLAIIEATMERSVYLPDQPRVIRHPGRTGGAGAYDCPPGT